MPAVGLEHYLLVAAVLFAIGAVGVVVRRNALILLMSIELMLNSVNLTLVAASRYNGNLDGQAMSLFVMAVAAAEAAVGLAIVIAVFRTRKTANIDELTMLEG